MDAQVTLLHGDCLELMPALAAASIDLILADLPYGTTDCGWDSVIPFPTLWSEYRRLLKPTGAVVLTAAQPFTSALVLSNPQWFRHEWIWHKSRPTGHLDARRRPLRDHESVLVFSPRPPRYQPQMRAGKPHQRGGGGKRSELWGYVRPAEATQSDAYFPRSVLPIRSVGRGVHPTQKPVELMEYMIRTYTEPGETVLDNTMGSGTTGVACLNAGRSFIGVERNAEYFRLAAERIGEPRRRLAA